MTELPDNLIIRPEVDIAGPESTDLLSHVLAQIHPTGDRVYSLTLAPEGRLNLEAEAAHVCIVTEGVLHLEGEAGDARVIETGDLVMAPRGACALRPANAEAPASRAL